MSFSSQVEVKFLALSGLFDVSVDISGFAILVLVISNFSLSHSCSFEIDSMLMGSVSYKIPCSYTEPIPPFKSTVNSLGVNVTCFCGMQLSNYNYYLILLLV